MKGAVMQPYFFPYIGYYQLVYGVEKFIFLDDVNFIKKGFIHRNSILLQGEKHDFSIPVMGMSQNRKIMDHCYAGDYEKFLLLLECAYRKAPYYSEVMPIIENVVLGPESNVALKNAKSIVEVFKYLGLEKEFHFSSQIDPDAPERAHHRIMKLCKILGIDEYINPIGGKELYSPEFFLSEGVGLHFIKNEVDGYWQIGGDFVPNLSMIDVLMHNSKSQVKSLLREYSLV